MDYFEESLKKHRESQGKWEINSKFELETRNNLSITYTPGVASVCEHIKSDNTLAYDLTMKGNLLSGKEIKLMAKDPIILAMANPIPEIMHDIAKQAGARIVGTGRSDFPNQVNNVLVFPGIFRGALNAKAKRITESMKIAAAHALASSIIDISEEKILPDPLDPTISVIIAKAVEESAIDEKVM